MRRVLTRDERAEMLRAYLAGKSSGVLARKFHVHDSYPRFLAWAARNPEQARQRHNSRGPA